MTLDPKALEVAKKANRNFGYKRAIQAYLDAADLVPRNQHHTDEMNDIVSAHIEIDCLKTERDEARRKARALDAGLDVASKKLEQEKAAKEKSRRENDALSKRIAALREALRELESWGRVFVEKTPISAETLWRAFPKALDKASAVLADTVAAEDAP
ncbi:hypothetical protein LCGC14_0707490 [marine sediment metagenome]|uniref:Uncharacterized protein n=1 Tax=marine sediment metagenome TaxID=412755 RepID=A0A0F9T1X5_9ZZZZ